MGAILPSTVAEYSLSNLLVSAGLVRSHRGKVRDTFQLEDSNLLLVLATDRSSIFDFVLNALIHQKGEILTALTAFWISQVLSPKGIKHHLVAMGKGIDAYIPISLRGNPELQKRVLIVEKLTMDPVEFVVRGYLTGSVLASYAESGTVFNIPIPSGLQDGSAFPEPLFTPTSKAEIGHDLPLNHGEVRNQYPEESDMAVIIYKILASYAWEKGIIIADTKLEFGESKGSRKPGDEIGTPDSSRFWDIEDWRTQLAVKKTPNPLDKQFLRNWGKKVGINERDPQKPEDITFVHSLVVPEDILSTTSSIYHSIFSRLTGCSLENFQREFLCIT